MAMEHHRVCGIEEAASFELPTGSRSMGLVTSGLLCSRQVDLRRSQPRCSPAMPRPLVAMACVQDARLRTHPSVTVLVASVNRTLATPTSSWGANGADSTASFLWGGAPGPRRAAEVAPH